jgi:hypothetical protein
MFFYSLLKPIFEEIGLASIGITEHNYTPKYDQTGTSGKYCVQFVFFRKDRDGLKALNWWKNACLDWCYARLEDGKFGDQKYLDDWIERFENVHVIYNRGVGVAPWNVQQYKLSNENKKVLKLSCINNKESFNLIFYHFHNLNFKRNQNEIEVSPSKFDLSLNVKKSIYIPYIDNLIKTESLINGFVIQNDFNYKFREYPFYIKLLLPIRILLKKVEMFRAINRFFFKSSRK